MVACPECDNKLDFDADEVDEGETVSCVECGTEFEVVTASPLELKAVGEGYEEDDEEDDDKAGSKAGEEDENGDY